MCLRLGLNSETMEKAELECCCVKVPGWFVEFFHKIHCSIGLCVKGELGFRSASEDTVSPNFGELELKLE